MPYRMVHMVHKIPYVVHRWQILVYIVMLHHGTQKFALCALRGMWFMVQDRVWCEGSIMVHLAISPSFYTGYSVAQYGTMWHNMAQYMAQWQGT